MTMEEMVDEVSFMLGIPSNENVEDLDVRKAVLIAFREAKRYIRTPTEKTVPFSTRVDLVKNGINAIRIRNVSPAEPKVGMNLYNVDSSNVFALAASQKYSSLLNSTTSSNLAPLVTTLAMAQVANTLSTDYQWRHDPENQVLYITSKSPRSSFVTIEYVPDFKDVSEVTNPTWIDIIIRLAQAYMKLALGRSRSKYTIEGSNVSLDGDTLLNEANTELQQIREEMEGKTNRMVVLD